MVNSAGLRPTRPPRTLSRVAVRTAHARAYDFVHRFVGTQNRPDQTQPHQQPQSRPQYPVHQSLPAVNPHQDIYGSFESSASQAQGYQGPPLFTREDEPIRFLPRYRSRPLQQPFYHLPSHVTGGGDNRVQNSEPVILGSPRAQKLSQLNDNSNDLFAVQIASADDSVHDRHVPRKLARKTGRQRKFVPQRLRVQYSDTDPYSVYERDGRPGRFSTKPSWHGRKMVAELATAVGEYLRHEQNALQLRFGRTEAVSKTLPYPNRRGTTKEEVGANSSAIEQKYQTAMKLTPIPKGHSTVLRQ